MQLWDTTYFQEMENHQGVFDWVKGTGLRPVLSMMNEKDQKEFSQFYLEAIAKAYPQQINKKVLLPFTRIFMVGVK